jgi:glutamate--cysteine ligase
MEDPGLESLASQADALLTKIRRKYKEYGIKEKPFIVVKTDDAAPGLGVVIVHDAKELPALSLTVQGRLADGKVLAQSRDVLLQEGVLTKERINDAVAEPVVFMMDRYVVGGFYRIHPDTGVDENLNLPGSSFVPLAFEHSTHLPQPGSKPGASAPNRFYMYGVVARLAMLAASYELEATDPNAEVYD